MSHKVEGFEVTVLGAPARNRALRFFEEQLYPRFPKLFGIVPETFTPWCESSMVIPRNPGARGNMTPEEAARIEDVALQLVDEIRPSRRPLYTSQNDGNDYLEDGSVRVRRVYGNGPLASMLLPDFLLKRDVTRVYEHMVDGGIAAEARGQLNMYHPDGVIAQAAARAMKELSINNIYADENQVALAIERRMDTARKALRPRGIMERLGAYTIPQAMRVLNVATHLVHLDLDEIAEQTALEGEIFRAVSGRNPVVGFGGKILGVIETGLSLLAESTGQGWLDIASDFLIGWTYGKVKFRGGKLFGREIDLHEIHRVLDIAGAAPVAPASLTLWSMQVYGRARLRKEIESGTPKGINALVTIAASRLLADYDKTNWNRRRHTLLESFGHAFRELIRP